ncbi:oligopeptide/dipeptide ABC transporter ATP-binding protein, partial [Tianweitania sp.]|uniref:oligopeptide/dipeptide ABC transporter ATP-binding protein n=1 Tax=Tianweitania sp. TaxID=2021634 RepID=UPI002ADE80B8
LTPIEGTPPSLTSPPAGCRFAPRCPRADDICRTGQPPPLMIHDAATPHHADACLLEGRP